MIRMYDLFLPLLAHTLWSQRTMPLAMSAMLTPE